VKRKIVTEKGKRQQRLRTVCAEVLGDISKSPEVQAAARDLVDTLKASPDAIGLAAPQIGIPMRIIAVRRGGDKITVLVNPVVERRIGWRMVEEGCLSLPKRTFLVQRAQVVRIRAQDSESGGVLRMSAQGNALAQAFEHEIDHLDGVLLTDKGRERDPAEKVLDPWDRR
jgi:peptide deformylase